MLLEKTHDARGVRTRTATTPRSWSGPTRRARWACAPTPTSPTRAANAIAFGAEGIGLCRTEHMFFGGDRIMTRARDDPRRDARGARGARWPSCCRCSATTSPASSARWASAGDHPHARPAAARVPAARRRGQRARLARGDRRPPRTSCAPRSRTCTRATRCSATAAAGSASPIPEITEMQARAILEAACAVKKEGIDVHPEIMIPLVGTKKELEHQAAIVRAVAARGVRRAGRRGRLPGRHDDRDPARRADRRRDRRGRRVLQLRHQRPHADDARRLPRRRRQVPAAVHERGAEIWPADPFETLDQEGVGPAGRDRRRAAAAARGRTSRSASAASTAATPRRSSSATASGWTT